MLGPKVVRVQAPLPVIAPGSPRRWCREEGVPLGPRFLAASESPWPSPFERVIVEGDGQGAEQAEIPASPGRRLAGRLRSLPPQLADR